MTQQLNTALVPEWTLGDRLRKARELADLEARQLADDIGVHRDTIANYEKGKVRPRQIVLRAWALRTGVSLVWLETGESPRPAGGPNGGLECAIRDSNPEPAGSAHRGGRWFGRSGERRGFMPIAPGTGELPERRRVVIPLAAGIAPVFDESELAA